MRRVSRISGIVGLGALSMALSVTAHEPKAQHPPAAKADVKPRGPIRITEHELHASGGMPPGWRFTIPAGDAQAGRAVFVKLECYSCHEVRGEQFTARTIDQQPGPDLTGMGDEHPAEYLAEAILNPNAVIITEPGYTAPDGLSIMPSYADLLTLQEWIDLVAYLKSLTAGHRRH
jgi:mono/diheme cytochrome c family protein